VRRVGRDHEGAPPYTQQIVFAHHPQHAFMVDLKAALLQFMRNSSVAIGRPLQRDLLHLIAQLHLHWRGLARHAPAVETSPA